MATFLGRGFRLHYEDQGHGDPIVFLPGYLLDGHLFDAQVACLRETYRCVVLDRRGHGQSECPPGPWSMDDLVDDVIDLIAHLDLGACHLVGMSLGGAEVTRIALRQPQLARSLIYVDAPADPRLPAGATFDVDDIAAHGLSDDLIELAALMLFGEKFRASHPDEVAAEVARIRELPRETFVEGFRINATTEPVLDQLAALTVPALILHGTDDIALPVAEAQQVARALAQSRLVMIDGAGHVSPREAPAAVTTAIGEFLDAIS